MFRISLYDAEGEMFAEYEVNPEDRKLYAHFDTQEVASVVIERVEE